ARANLKTSMGLSDTSGIDRIVDTLSYRKYDITLDKALENAYDKRADLKALRIKRQAAEASVELVKKDYYPVLSANANYEVTGNRLPLNDGWAAGMTVTLPVFNGFLTKHQVEESKSSLSVIKANEESLRLSILFDVQQAYLSLQDAESRIPTAELAMRQAEENLELAQGRYAVGVGSPIEVTDALVSYTNAKASHIQALYDYKVAQATLERAMGER
ncbi:MAG: TolC family protein, partial [Nitrospirales bacterium]|nr:TolC family protein [Nitrospirales bacterium]